MYFDLSQLRPETVLRLQKMADTEGLKTPEQAVLFILDRDSRIIKESDRRPLCI